jgi:predicted nucleic acid-binding protein
LSVAPALVLLDNTVLSNFALVAAPTKWVLDLWGRGIVATTEAVWREYQTGVSRRHLPADVWHGLPVLTLTVEEGMLLKTLPAGLGHGERSCIALAVSRGALFASDDLDARKIASALTVPVTGTVGLLVLGVRRNSLGRQQANQLLAEMISHGYRSPVTQLDELLG